MPHHHCSGIDCIAMRRISKAGGVVVQLPVLVH
jgi:hypothetical protein